MSLCSKPDGSANEFDIIVEDWALAVRMAGNRSYHVPCGYMLGFDTWGRCCDICKIHMPDHIWPKIVKKWSFLHYGH